MHRFTHTTFATVAGTTVTWSREPGDRESVPLHWDPETGQAAAEASDTAATGPVMFDPDRWRVGIGIKNCAVLHAALAQRSHRHPSRPGLIPHIQPQMTMSTSVLPLVPCGAEALQVLTMVPWPDRANGVGWFSPLADRLARGTLFIAASTTNHCDNVDTTWHLMQVGYPTPLATASWRDSDTIRRLWAEVRANDIEAHLAMRALTLTPSIRTTPRDTDRAAQIWRERLGTAATSAA